MQIAAETHFRGILAAIPTPSQGRVFSDQGYVAMPYDLYERFRPLIEAGMLAEALEEARGKHYEKGLFD